MTLIAAAWPLFFEVFDEFGFKITVTAFIFWADWAENGNVWRE